MERLRQAAATQHGVLLSGTVRRLGVTRAQERRLRAEGWLVSVQAGAVVVGGGPPSRWQKVVAAWLLCGPGSVVSHATAASIHRFAGMLPADSNAAVEISVVRPAHPRPSGCVVHRIKELPGSSVTAYRGIPVTTPPRTLVDILPRLAPAALKRVVDEGIIARLWDVSDLERAVAAAARRAGVDDLRKLLVYRSERPGSGRNAIEARVERALACFAPFETQHQVVLDGHVFVLDIAWPELRVVVECEGWDVRSRSRGKFDHERRRDNILVAHGWVIVRLTSAMSDDEMRAAVHRVLLRAAAAAR